MPMGSVRCGTPGYRSPGPVAFAIEVAAGWFEKNDVSVGDAVKINLPPELEVR